MHKRIPPSFFDAHKTGAPQELELSCMNSCSISSSRCGDGTFIETSDRGHTNILVINDHPTNIAGAIPMKGTNAFQIAQDFFKHWVFVNGIPKTMLIDNGTKFDANFLLQHQRMLGLNIILLQHVTQKRTGRRSDITEQLRHLAGSLRIIQRTETSMPMR